MKQRFSISSSGPSLVGCGSYRVDDAIGNQKPRNQVMKSWKHFLLEYWKLWRCRSLETLGKKNLQLRERKINFLFCKKKKKEKREEKSWKNNIAAYSLSTQTSCWMEIYFSELNPDVCMHKFTPIQRSDFRYPPSSPISPPSLPPLSPSLSLVLLLTISPLHSSPLSFLQDKMNVPGRKKFHKKKNFFLSPSLPPSLPPSLVAQPPPPTATPHPLKPRNWVSERAHASYKLQNPFKTRRLQVGAMKF